MSNQLSDVPLDNRNVPFVRAFAIRSNDNSELLNTYGVPVVMDIVHYRIHNGQTFRSWYVVPHDEPLADDGVINMIITTGALNANIVTAVSSGGDAEYAVYRDPTFTDGTVLPIRNMNHASSKLTTCVVTLNPTVSDPGVQIDGAFIPGGRGGQPAGGTIRESTEAITNIHTSYLIQVINRSGQARQIGMKLQWYEQEQE